MEAFLIYLGKTAVSTASFYLAFIILFKNQKHFVFNRLYLPFSFLTGFIIPLFTFTTVKYIELTNSPAAAEQTHSNLTPVISESPEFVFQWYHYLSGIYILGYIGFLFYLIYGYFKAQSIINNCEKKTLFDSEVYITKKDVHPFSFFNKIVLSERALKNPKLDMIISHEKIHVKERHTLDIIFAEILFLFQWFNPFAWLIKDAIKNNLEYKTDDVLTKQYNSEQYQLTMVGLAHKKGVAPFLNALNGSQLKNRLIMMKKKTENKYTLLKQLVVLPLIAILVMGLANREVKTEIIQEKTQPKIENVKKEPILIRGRVIDEYGNIITGANVAEYDTLGRVIGGTITNKNGDFVLQLRQNFEKATIRCSHTGYETKEVVVDTKENKPLLIRLDKKEPSPQKQQQSEPESIPAGKSKKRESLIIRGLDSDSTGTPIIFDKTGEPNPEREPSKSIDKQNNKIEKKDSSSKVKVSLSDKIVADAKQFQYLIGMEYSDYSELGNFTKHSRSSRGSLNGEKVSVANLVQGEKQIITSEITTLDEQTNLEVHKIQDVIVLNGYYTTCGACLLSKNKKNEILSIYRLGTVDDDALLIAFERNRKTGKYKQVNPDNLERNPIYLADQNKK